MTNSASGGIVMTEEAGPASTLQPSSFRHVANRSYVSQRACEYTYVNEQACVPTQLVCFGCLAVHQQEWCSSAATCCTQLHAPMLADCRQLHNAPGSRVLLVALPPHIECIPIHCSCRLKA